MTAFNPDALTIDADGMDLLANVLGTHPEDGSDQRLRSAFDPGRFPLAQAGERRLVFSLHSGADLALADS